jgi:hypothetical protein
VHNGREHASINNKNTLCELLFITASDEFISAYGVGHHREGMCWHCETPFQLPEEPHSTLYQLRNVGRKAT